MKLIVKFNLLLAAVFLIGLGASYYYARDLLQANALAEIQGNARIMMESALAVRAYTNSQITPLLATQQRYQFMPQSIPSYSAVEYFKNLRKRFPEYDYKEATINPTNPRDRAVDWEVDIVNHFVKNAQVTELMGDRVGPLGRTLYLAKPLRITDPACLVCHSTPEAAPQTMIEQYTPINGGFGGFKWQLNDVVGAQIVSVPYAVPVERADAVLVRLQYLLGGVYLFLFVALNVLLCTLVLRPVSRLSRIADQVSVGAMDAPEFPTQGGDEIAALGTSFNRMRRSLVEALRLLDK